MSQPTGTQTTDPKTSTNTDPNAAGSGKGDDKADGTKTGTDADKTGSDDGLKKALQSERKLREQAEKALREHELSKLPELERFKSESERLAKENEKLTLENTKMRIGLELGLKWSVAKRITGDSEAEMRSDAADLLKEIRTDVDGPGKSTKDKDAANRAKTNDGGKTGPAGKPDMNELFRRAAGRTAR